MRNNYNDIVISLLILCESKKKSVLLKGKSKEMNIVGEDFM